MISNVAKDLATTWQQPQ